MFLQTGKKNLNLLLTVRLLHCSKCTANGTGATEGLAIFPSREDKFQNLTECLFYGKLEKI